MLQQLLQQRLQQLSTDVGSSLHCLWSSVHCHCFLNAPEANAHASAHGTGFWSTKLRYHVKTRGAFKDLRVEPSGKVIAANSYPKHNPTHYNQTNRRALTKLCLGQAAQNKLSSCGCKAVLQAPDFTSFSLMSLKPHRPATAPSLQLLKQSLLRHFKVALKPPKQTVPNWS